MAESSSSSTTEHSEEPPSLLDRLRSPTPSDLARKRRIPCNPPKGTKKGRGTVASEPQNVSPHDRVKQFPDDHLGVVSGKLFCIACRENLSLKKSVVTMHVQSTKHTNGLERLASKEKRERTIAEMLKKYDQQVHPAGEKLPESVRVYRIRVLSCFLKAGVPLNKVDSFRDILEEGAYRLTNSKHLSEMIPFIRQQEQERLRDEIAGKSISVVFDGTTHVCEALVLVIRFVDEQWCIHQRVAKMMLLAKSMAGEELARELIVSLSTELGITNDRFVASMHDRASVNNVAMQTLKVLYPGVIDIGCFSHMLDIVGDKFHTPILNEFIKGWIGMFSRSPKTKLAWRTKTGIPVPTYCATRWWSKWEVMRHMHDSFGDVHSFLQDSNLPPSRLKLLQVLDDLPQCRKLQMELAITIDAGEPFVKATYHLEGDGPLVFTVYEEISKLLATISNEHYPNVVAIANKLTSVPTLRNQLVKYAKACVKSGFEYFERKIRNDLAVQLAIFKHARMFDPAKVADLKPTQSEIQALRIFPFLNNDSVIEGLVSELPRYVASAEDVSPVADKRAWWKRHEDNLPNWAKACKSLLLIQPSSAAAERVFSILSNSFTEKQTHSLRDYIEASVMLQYNTRSTESND